MLQPLNNLLRSDMKCEWSTLCTEAVHAAWQALMSSKVLTLLPTILAAKASQYGIGMVVLYVCKDGSKRLSAQAQMERKVLSIMFSIKESIITCMGMDSTC